MIEKIPFQPNQEFLKEDRASLEDLLQKMGAEHAVAYAKDVRDSIKTFIQTDILVAQLEDSPEMKEKWRAELSAWRQRLKEIDAFIVEHTRE